MLSACGGGGGGATEQPSMPAAAVAASSAPAPGVAALPAPGVAALSAPPSSDPSLNASTAVVASAGPFPEAATNAAQYPADDTGAYTLLPATAPTDSGGEPPYPDLRQLPTRVMAFQPVVYGDVSAVKVIPAG